MTEKKQSSASSTIGLRIQPEIEAMNKGGFTFWPTSDHLRPVLGENQLCYAQRIEPVKWDQVTATILLQTYQQGFVGGVLSAIDPETITLQFANPAYPPVSVPRSEVFALYEVFFINRPPDLSHLLEQKGGQNHG